MPDKKDKEQPEAAPGTPGSEEWESRQKVLAGDVEPGTGDLSHPVEREAPDEDEKA